MLCVSRVPTTPLNILNKSGWIRWELSLNFSYRIQYCVLLTQFHMTNACHEIAVEVLLTAYTLLMSPTCLQFLSCLEKGLGDDQYFSARCPWSIWSSIMWHWTRLTILSSQPGLVWCVHPAAFDSFCYTSVISMLHGPVLTEAGDNLETNWNAWVKVSDT